MHVARKTKVAKIILIFSDKNRIEEREYLESKRYLGTKRSMERKKGRPTV
jgi:hypothetical protein